MLIDLGARRRRQIKNGTKLRRLSKHAMWIQLIRYIRKGLSNTVFLFNSWYLDTETCMRKLSYCSFCIYGGRCVDQSFRTINVQ